MKNERFGGIALVAENESFDAGMMLCATVLFFNCCTQAGMINREIEELTHRWLSIFITNFRTESRPFENSYFQVAWSWAMSIDFNVPGLRMERGLEPQGSIRFKCAHSGGKGSEGKSKSKLLCSCCLKNSVRRFLAGSQKRQDEKSKQERIERK